MKNTHNQTYISLNDTCKCNDFAPIKIMSTLSSNPINCMKCNLEIDLQKLNLSNKIFGMILEWRNIHDPLYLLWLNSDTDESFALEQLTNINSELNIQGLLLNKAINKHYKCYYWYFHNSSLEIMEKCPICCKTLLRFEASNILQKICEESLIVLG